MRFDLFKASRASESVDNASRNAQQSKPASPDIHVLLTGSTGNMGAYILHSLLSHPEITHTTCLNRSSDASTRQLSNHSSRGLDSSAEILRSKSPRVTFLTVDFANPTLGLSNQQYNDLADTATLILHNAWPVSFNLSFSSFHPSLLGVKHLISLALSCKHRCTLTFISSVSVVGRWGTLPGSTSSVPEVILRDWRTAKMGYGQSKLVAENLCVKASEECGLKTSVVRIGQVAGPVGMGLQGRWSEWEWFPSLVRSSQVLRVVPATLGPMDGVDWIPVDVLGTVIAEIVLYESGLADGGVASERMQQSGKTTRLPKFLKTSSHPSNTSPDGLVTIYHASNPAPTTYSTTLLPIILEYLHNANGTNTSITNPSTSRPKQLNPVPFIEWITALEKSARSKNNEKDQASQNPATKLLSFFKDLQDKATRFPDARSAVLETRRRGGSVGR